MFLFLVCPAEPDILAIILGVIAGIVGVGLALLLIWKLLATLKVISLLLSFILKGSRFDKVAARIAMVIQTLKDRCSTRG